MAQESPPTLSPRVRVARFVVDGYRSIREPLQIDFTAAIEVFHGDNGTGKSTVLDALRVFFELAAASAESGPRMKEPGAQDWSLNEPMGHPFSIPAASWDLSDVPRGPDRASPTRMELHLSNGAAFELTIDFNRPVPEASLASIRGAGTELNAFLFPPSRTPPFGILRANRSSTWNASMYAARPDAAVAALIDEQARRRDPETRARLDSFYELLASFQVFANRRFTNEPTADGEGTEFVVAEPKRSVLGFQRLSSGEQQILLVLAQLFANGPRVVAIQEPEISLDHRNQALLRETLQKLTENGSLHQVILESHSPHFDGPTVVRFELDDGVPTAHRASPVRSEKDAALEAQARAAGAESLWVTRDGWTQLPEAMVQDLAVPPSGGCVWFLKGKHGWTPRLMEQDEAAEEALGKCLVSGSTATQGAAPAT